MKFEYDEMTVRQGLGELIYEMRGKKYYDLMSALNGMGQYGWELVMQNNGKYIFKKPIYM